MDAGQTSEAVTWGNQVNTEADTCRKFVVPRLQTAGWEGAPHAINEQRTFTDGRVIFVGGKAKRGRQKRADYILRYRADYPIAVVEAKAAYKSAADGLQQAKDYAEILGLKFAAYKEVRLDSVSQPMMPMRKSFPRAAAPATSHTAANRNRHFISRSPKLKFPIFSCQ